MAWLHFNSKGGGVSTSTHPFKLLITTAKSGISSSTFNVGCPCDSGKEKITSLSIFDSENVSANIVEQPELAFRVFSGSKLFTRISLDNPSGKYNSSFQGLKNESIIPNDCSYYSNNSLMTIFGLETPIFIKDFFGKSAAPDSTLKIWLSICFPAGDQKANNYDLNSVNAAVSSSMPNGQAICDNCEGRANIPMVAFIACSTGDWGDLITSRLINKGSSGQPRLEKRAVACKLPLGEINQSGKIVAQYCTSHLTLTDMCINGIPCKYPISIFSE